ncbi:hypothetical protein Ancab_034450, partial [Ancistrocladus abbreviatus]
MKKMSQPPFKTLSLPLPVPVFQMQNFLKLLVLGFGFWIREMGNGKWEMGFSNFGWAVKWKSAVGTRHWAGL